MGPYWSVKVSRYGERVKPKGRPRGAKISLPRRGPSEVKYNQFRKLYRVETPEEGAMAETREMRFAVTGMT